MARNMERQILVDKIAKLVIEELNLPKSCEAIYRFVFVTSYIEFRAREDADGVQNLPRRVKTYKTKPFKHIREIEKEKKCVVLYTLNLDEMECTGRSPIKLPLSVETRKKLREMWRSFGK